MDSKINAAFNGKSNSIYAAYPNFLFSLDRFTVTSQLPGKVQRPCGPVISPRRNRRPSRLRQFMRLTKQQRKCKQQTLYWCRNKRRKVASSSQEKRPPTFFFVPFTIGPFKERLISSPGKMASGVKMVSIPSHNKNARVAMLLWRKPFPRDRDAVQEHTRKFLTRFVSPRTPLREILMNGKLYGGKLSHYKMLVKLHSHRKTGGEGILRALDQTSSFHKPARFPLYFGDSKTNIMSTSDINYRC